jgi:uncharacterized LabA/DUF88 family protein
MLSSQENQVSIFIDFENIELSLETKSGRKDIDVDWSRVMGAAVEFGRIAVRKAYADWSSYQARQRELLGLGIDLVHVPSKRGKNACDIRIVIDALEMLLSERNNITHVMLVSGDGDFTELVHRLRGRGIYVVGMGVSGASAEYLVNACDQFIYYDLLAGVSPAQATDQDIASTTVIHEISEARQLLRRALESRKDEWVSAGSVKHAMLRLNPAFNERNYNFDSFKAFLAAQSDLVHIETAEGGHLEVQLIPETEAYAADQAPETLLDHYLEILAAQKVIMTPTPYRPRIILKFWDTYYENQGRSLTEIKEELHAYYEDYEPQVKYQSINEVIHQLFRTFCFTFDQDDEHYPPNTRLWDRVVKLNENIHGRKALLEHCDRGLLQRIARSLGSAQDIDTEVAARLLYGSLRGPQMLDHVNHLIGTLE